MCRQFISECEDRNLENIPLILSGQSGAVTIFNTVKDLLPFSFGKDNLEITLNFTHGLDAQAKVFSDYLNQEFVRKANEAKDLTTKATYENTKAISSNGYITVVTRLPRGSIDSLLKQ